MSTGNRVKSTGSKTGESFGKGLKNICYFLTMLFCTLRARDVIDWPWFLVMSPIFISWIITIAALVIAGLLAVSLVNGDGDK